MTARGQVPLLAALSSIPHPASPCAARPLCHPPSSIAVHVRPPRSSVPLLVPRWSRPAPCPPLVSSRSSLFRTVPGCCTLDDKLFNNCRDKKGDTSSGDLTFSSPMARRHARPPHLLSPVAHRPPCHVLLPSFVILPATASLMMNC